MTKKRFEGLCRAYFTRLNEWAMENGSETMNMGRVYRAIPNITNNLGTDEFGNKITRDQWWGRFAEANINVFGVGIRAKEVR